MRSLSLRRSSVAFDAHLSVFLENNEDWLEVPGTFAQARRVDAHTYGAKSHFCTQFSRSFQGSSIKFHRDAEANVQRPQRRRAAAD